MHPLHRACVTAAAILVGFLASSVVVGQCPNGGLPNGGCTLPPTSCGCNPPIQPSQCFPDTSGPAFWLDPGNSAIVPTSHTRTALKSPSTTSYGQLPTGSRPACNGVPSSPAPTLSVRLVGQRIMVDYDIPNYYCQDTGDWPVFYTCTTDIEAANDRLTLRQGTTIFLRRGWIYYEKGTWDTGYDVPCGSSNTYSAAVKILTTSGNVITESAEVPLPAPSPCPPPPPPTGKPAPYQEAEGRRLGNRSISDRATSRPAFHSSRLLKVRCLLPSGCPLTAKHQPTRRSCRRHWGPPGRTLLLRS
jgi:hypothetical protein